MVTVPYSELVVIISENILCKRENMSEGKKNGDTVGSEAAQAVGVLYGVKKPFFERKFNWIPIQN